MSVLRLLFLYVLSFVVCLAALAQDDAVYFELTDSTLLVFPRETIKSQTDDGHRVLLQLKGDTTITINKTHIKSQDNYYPGELARMESFKFNNKYNDQLYTDALGKIDDADGTVKVSVGCIGKWLTPSFQLTNGAKAYIDGRRQYSKETRRRFDLPVVYTVAYPKHYVYQCEEVSAGKYRKGFVPYGRQYEVTVDFLTDHPTGEYGVPRIDISFADGVSWDSNTWIGRLAARPFTRRPPSRLTAAACFPICPKHPCSSVDAATPAGMARQAARTLTV